MAGAPSRLEGDQPQSEEHARGIDCPVSVLQSLRASVLERFNSVPHGGGEVTGVLFGTRNGDELRVTAFCAIGGDHALSQSEELTEAQRAVTAVISAAPDREELAGLEPVGWFRAHPRCDLNLSERDLEIANTLFPHPWQVALTMRPGNSAASRVRFYFRDAEGPWTRACAVREFTLPAADLQPAREFPADPAEDAGTELALPEMPSHLEALAGLPEMRTVGRRSPLVWPLAAIAVAGRAGGIYWFMFMRPQPLALHVQATDSAAQLRIAWDRTAGAIRHGMRGYLEVADGGQSLRLDLDAEELHIGYLNYPRRSNDVTVRMVVETDGGAPAEDVARFLAPTGQAPVAETAQNPAPESRAASAPENPPELVVPVPVDNSAPVEERPKFQAPAPKPARSVVMDQPAAPEVTAPAQGMRGAPISVMTIPVVRADPPPEKAPPLRPVNANPAPAPASTATQSPARGAAPRVTAAPGSGRVIWIGRLQKNQPVTISGKNCSMGTLIGELPARPFRFSVSPGDLSGSGMVLYTSNLQYANNVVEPPGAENGWNKTVYTWNPKYANDVSIDEAPAAQNGWNRLVLHSKNPKISVLVIDWTAVN